MEVEKMLVHVFEKIISSKNNKRKREIFYSKYSGAKSFLVPRFTMFQRSDVTNA